MEIQFKLKNMSVTSNTPAHRMQFIYHIAIFLVGVILSPVRTQLLYTDPTRDDGPCKYPSPVPLFSANFLINPFKSYYIPIASENFFRFEYNMATNRPPQTEDEVTSLQTKVFISLKDLFTHLAPVTVSFFGRDDIHYSYRLKPSFMLSSLPNPVFDLNATAIHGSSGTAETGYAGEIKFTIIWNDGTPAYNIYTCVGGRQMFHIVSGKPKLTDEQFETNKKILMDLGISPYNFQYLKYDD